MQEWHLYEAWFRFAGTGKILKWQNHTLQIIHPGQLNEHQGPDIQGSRFIYNGITYYGAVEMHVHINDWYNHSHHQDPAYRNVLLHVVIEGSEQSMPVHHTQNPEPIPTFVLPLKRSKSIAAHSCRPKNAGIEFNFALEKLALQRLDLKIFQFYKALQVYSAGQVFYQSFFRALGYPYNKYAFELLAARLPLAHVSLQKFTEERLTALYLGSAGFLKENHKDIYAVQLYTYYQSEKTLLVFRELDEKTWCLAGVRPFNHPQWRLAGWVNLLLDKQSFNIFTLLSRIVDRRLEYPELLKTLERFFTVSAQGYWQSHFGLDKPFCNIRPNTFFGRERIREIIINLVIPLSIAQARLRGSSGLELYLTEFYLLLPQKNVYHRIKRQLPWLPLDTQVVKRASSNQGLLQLHEHNCRVKNCHSCPIGYTPGGYKTQSLPNRAINELF